MKVKEYYDSDEFKSKYLYEGTDLGAVCKKNQTEFRLWSPLAAGVWLNLYEDGEAPMHRQVPMKKGEKGVWMHTEMQNCHGIYYDFTVDMDGEKIRTADPYAKACNCNGRRSMAVELSRTNPQGWDTDHAPALTTEQVIYEIHVKDFSYDPASGVPEEYRGKYKAFTLNGTTLNNDGEHSTCLDYLKKLGITHVQLMPVFDFGSVNEAGDASEYNWGYDPLNYNVPEGSYSTDPFHGEVRIRELKELVMALHRNGLRVIMDVVYNHTYSIDSWFSRTVPCYFYRQYENGCYSDGSACGNDIASEREMCAKYILESVLYWAKEYHMDGFRFDLMGLLDVELMSRIQRELDETFGQGEVMVYGEPWSASDSPMKEDFHPCLGENIRILHPSVGVFCDKTRDAIKGHVFYEEVPGFVNGGKRLEEKILHAVRAWTDGGREFCAGSPRQIISYVSAHDNLTLWDKLMVTLKPGEDFLTRDEEVLRANKMAAAIYFTCQGSLFFLAGEEGARTKLGNSNSFNASPQLNRLDWERIYAYEDLVEYYRGLIAFRKKMPGLCDKSGSAGERIFDVHMPWEGCLQFCVDNKECEKWEVLCILYNSIREEKQIDLPEGKWELLVDESSSRLWQNSQTAQEKTISPVSVRIFGRKK
ncbi:MAG: type I pullulanase [Eubacteriales bacterium]|nr:type I pullulanase [Eubacteriales bacterium]